MVVGLNAQALKVNADGNVGIGTGTPAEKLVVNGNVNVDGQFMRVGSGAGAGGAKIEFGEGRSSNGPATLDLVSDVTNYPDFGVRFARFADGNSQFQHRGTQPFVFNALDGATFFFQTSGVNRFLVNSTGLLPGNNNVHSLGSASNRWTEVWAANGTIQTSDLSTKTNIQESPYGLDEVMKLRPVTFEWKDDQKYGLKVGLIAQEVQPIINEVVRTKYVQADSDGQRNFKETEVMGLNYSELIPVLITAIQQQQADITSKEEKLDELEEQVLEMEDQLAKVLEKINQSNDVKIGAVKSEVQIRGTELATLSQNRPNPFNGITKIDYEIPSSANSASLNFYNPNGQLVKMVSIDHTGLGELTFRASDIPSGTYSYTLVVDGKHVGTKLMVLN